MRRKPRPTNLATIEEVFAWLMPGGPPANGCWDWTSTLTHDGYGTFSFGNKMKRAHVVSYEIHVGPTNGLHVLHWCDRPICVQPTCLHLGTQKVNMAERQERGRTPRGSKHGIARLTEADVIMIRESPLGYKKLAAQLRVSPMTIKRARSGETWGHVSSPVRQDD